MITTNQYYLFEIMELFLHYLYLAFINFTLIIIFCHLLCWSMLSYLSYQIPAQNHHPHSHHLHYPDLVTYKSLLWFITATCWQYYSSSHSDFWVHSTCSETLLLFSIWVMNIWIMYDNYTLNYSSSSSSSKSSSLYFYSSSSSSSLSLIMLPFNFY